MIAIYNLTMCISFEDAEKVLEYMQNGKDLKSGYDLLPERPELHANRRLYCLFSYSVSYF